MGPTVMSDCHVELYRNSFRISNFQVSVVSAIESVPVTKRIEGCNQVRVFYCFRQMIYCEYTYFLVEKIWDVCFS